MYRNAGNESTNDESPGVAQCDSDESVRQLRPVSGRDARDEMV
jgi:hypothetical protein